MCESMRASPAPMPRHSSHAARIAGSTPCFCASCATAFLSGEPVTSAAAARHLAALEKTFSRCVVRVSTAARTSRNNRSGRPGATSRGFSHTAKSFAFPSPASEVARYNVTSLFPAAGAGIFIRTSRALASGVTGTCHAFGPSRLPICPTCVKRHKVCCHWAIVFVRAAASPGFAARHCIRTSSSTSDGFGSFSASQSVARYLAFSPCERATSAIDFFFDLSAARSATVASKYFSSGRTPPSLVSNLMPCRFTAEPPPGTE